VEIQDKEIFPDNLLLVPAIKTCLLLIALDVSLVFCTSPTTATAPAKPTPAATPALAATAAPVLTGVKKLEISDENADVLQHLERYPDLEVLSVSCAERLSAIPDSIGRLTKLKELRMDNGNGCSMNPVLPEAIGNLASLETLVLYGAQDPREPGESGSQSARRTPQVPAKHVAAQESYVPGLGTKRPGRNPAVCSGFAQT